MHATREVKMPQQKKLVGAHREGLNSSMAVLPNSVVYQVVVK